MTLSTPVTIALDAMGGDFGPQVVVPAALDYLKRDKDVRLILVGREEDLTPHLTGVHPDERVEVRHAADVVGMDELPSKALRNKKNSSMRVAIDLVKDGIAQACVSAGNTGALMAIARFVLKTLPNVDRPAIITAIPSIEGHTYMLDLGANVDCTAEHLFEFAVMGSEMVAAVEGISAPRVGLLNIGAEEIKGNEQVKRAHELLGSSTLNYIGYVEGDDVYRGGVDIVVCDGFVGNVALKSSEGVAKMIGHFLKQEFGRNWLTKSAAIVSLPVLRRFRASIDPRRYNGAGLLGLQGIVIKSHGGADVLAFGNAIGVAKRSVFANVQSRIAEQVTIHLMPKVIT